MAEYPEHEKMQAVLDQSRVIGEFLGWLTERYTICDGPNKYDEFTPAHINIQELLADYFEIDLDKIEEEKRQMLEEIRSLNPRPVNFGVVEIGEG